MKHAELWHTATKSEMYSIYANDRWELVPLPANKKAILCKWVFRYKYISGTEQPKYKAQLVTKGFKQQQGVDYDEILSPAVKMTTLCYLLGVVAANDLELEQMDVKTTFLHRDLCHEDIYMSQSAGFMGMGGDHLVCPLKKSLYGLKQASCMRYEKFNYHIWQLGYRRSNSDPCLYVKRGKDQSRIFLILYMYVMLIVGKDRAANAELKEKIHKNFSMKELRNTRHQHREILCMQIERNRLWKILRLSQQDYVWKVLRTFNIENPKPTRTLLATSIHQQIRTLPYPKRRENI